MYYACVHSFSCCTILFPCILKCFYTPLSGCYLEWNLRPMTYPSSFTLTTRVRFKRLKYIRWYLEKFNIHLEQSSQFWIWRLNFLEKSFLDRNIKICTVLCVFISFLFDFYIELKNKTVITNIQCLIFTYETYRNTHTNF